MPKLNPPRTLQLGPAKADGPPLARAMAANTFVTVTTGKSTVSRTTVKGVTRTFPVVHPEEHRSPANSRKASAIDRQAFGGPGRRRRLAGVSPKGEELDGRCERGSSHGFEVDKGFMGELAGVMRDQPGNTTLRIGDPRPVPRAEWEYACPLSTAFIASACGRARPPTGRSPTDRPQADRYREESGDTARVRIRG